MNSENIYLLNVLKSFIHHTNPGSFQGSWHALLQLSSIHSVTGILGYSVMKYPNESSAPVASFMRNQCLNTITLQTQRAAKMQELIQKMNEEQIDHLLFKGYVLKDYYPVPELRTYGDIDFLIRSFDRQKLDELMIREGFQRSSDKEPVFSYIRQSEYYEVHTDVMEADISEEVNHQEYFSHIWEHAHLVEGHTWHVSPEYHFLYLLTHIAKHISTFGAGIRMYLDVAVFIQHFGNELDWDYIQREAEVLQLDKLTNMILTVVQEYFGVESPVLLNTVDTSVLEDFIEFTMTGGTFGYVGRDAGLVALRKEDENVEKLSRAGTFFQRLFPSANYLEKYYTYLKGRHWLLPVAWIHRWCHGITHWSSYSNVAESIMNTDEQEVLRLRRLYKEIGL